MTKLTVTSSSVVLVTLLAAGACGGAPPTEPAPAEEATESSALHPTRLYIFDCGHISFADLTPFSLELDEVATPELSVPCFLIEHERGTLMWDLGFSDELYPEGETFTEGPLAGAVITVANTLGGQLADIGYQPTDIDYFSMSHMHLDHSGNASLFRDSTWLARTAEVEYAFGMPEGIGWVPEVYEALRETDPVVIDGDHDVFGDATVVIKSAPGHTPGHQVLFIDLAETGPVVLSGDLYHFPESRELRRVPLFNFDEELSLASMDAVEAFLEQSAAQLWIEHDFAHNATLRKAPEFYQ